MGILSLLFIFLISVADNPIITQYKKAIKTNPSDVQAYKNLGLEYIKVKNWDEAIKYFKRGLDIVPKEVQPQDEGLLYWLGTCYYFKEDYSRAEATFLRSVEANPSVDAYFNLATVLARQKKYNETINTFKKALEVNLRLNLPTDTRILFHLAGTYLVMGEYQSAIDTYTRVIELFPSDPRGYEGRASAYWKIGNNELSIADIKMAKEVRSGFRLGIAKPQEKKEEKREENEFRDIYTSDPEVLYSVGEIHQATGEFELAVKTFSAAIRLNPRQPKYYDKRAEAYKSLGKDKESASDKEKAKELRNK
ncbi:MAG: tetratricopeptide repeat protein [Candidatus Stahlbacteria bacterium]|nr:tetratricopeptide repeat protein [Candidatus Stahlbacteria bacterium]